jgi:MbtH protein
MSVNGIDTTADNNLGNGSNGSNHNGNHNGNNNDNGNNEPNYVVVRNAEEQYSIWPAGRDLPAGWDPDGTTGSKDECLAHITQVWTDMRPLSLRRRMELNNA